MTDEKVYCMEGPCYSFSKHLDEHWASGVRRIKIVKGPQTPKVRGLAPTSQHVSDMSLWVERWKPGHHPLYIARFPNESSVSLTSPNSLFDFMDKGFDCVPWICKYMHYNIIVVRFALREWGTPVLPSNRNKKAKLGYHYLYFLFLPVQSKESKYIGSHSFLSLHQRNDIDGVKNYALNLGNGIMPNIFLTVSF